MDKLLRQLKKEIRANPAKAGVLVVLVGVLSWFIVPLVWPAGDTPPRPAPAADGSTPTLPTTDATPAVADAPTSAARPDWRAVVRGMAADPRMTTRRLAADLSMVRSPFARPEPPVDPQEPTTEELEAWLAELTPATPAVAAPPPAPTFHLSSVLVGPKLRTAVLDGKLVREGATLTTAAGDVWTLVEVRPREVTLAHGDVRHVIRLPERRAAESH